MPKRQEKARLSEDEEDEFNEGDYDQEERITKRSLAAAKKNMAKIAKKKKKSKDSDGDSETEEESVDEDAAARPAPKKRLQRATQPASKGSGSDSDDVQLSNSDSDTEPKGLKSRDRPRNLNSQPNVDRTKSAEVSGPKRVEGRKESTSDDDDENDDTGENLYDTSSRNKDKKSKKGRTSTNRAAPSRVTIASKAKGDARKAPAKWTAEEDAILKTQFGIFRGSRSVFEVIAMDPELM